jgi:CRP/FNR family cyclic AMP-dependent transcriptional regulator
MSPATTLADLKKHPFTEGFEPAHLERLAALAREVHFDADQIIFREGDYAPDFHLIIEGRVALEMQEPDHVLRIQTLFSGDELGWSAILTGSGKYFQARALVPTTALAFDGRQLLEACREDKAFGFALMTHMVSLISERLQATRLQLHDMHSPKAKRAGA